MESSTIAQLRLVLADQQRGLKELRKRRREDYERIAEKDAKEIEYLLGIEETKRRLRSWRRIIR